ncbi:MAG: hypothetical protein ACK5ES_01975, partial [Planctomyces sp.]
QRDYLLTLELLNIHTGESVTESAMLRKGYHKRRWGRWVHYGDVDDDCPVAHPFTAARAFQPEPPNP